MIKKEDILKIDMSPEKMKKVKEMFKDIEHIKVPYSGAEILKMVRTDTKLFPIMRKTKNNKSNGNGKIV
ncbi:hypothetical protein HYT56_03290 [Candidatus Woesearchaeota archaeon]|nr:hypothetical protein [Candidatus Woesearchaeota archaeon]